MHQRKMMEPCGTPFVVSHQSDISDASINKFWGNDINLAVVIVRLPVYAHKIR